MMNWDGDGSWPNSGAGYVLMVLAMLVFWGLIVAAVVLVLRLPNRQAHAIDDSVGAPRSSQQVLAERFAAGEIDEAEFGSRLATLRRHQLL